MSRRSHENLYLIGPMQGPQKIGVSVNVPARLRMLQCGSSAPLRVHKVWACGELAAEVEGQVHAELSRLRLIGEWFQIDPAEAIARVDKHHAAIGLFGSSRPILKAPARLPIEPLSREPIQLEPRAYPMLNGNTVACSRLLSGIGTQRALATMAGVSILVVRHAEAAKEHVAKMNVRSMARIVAALEAAGIEFTLEPGRSLNGGVSMRRRA